MTRATRLLCRQVSRGDGSWSHPRPWGGALTVAAGPPLLSSGRPPAVRATPLFKERDLNLQCAFPSSISRENNKSDQMPGRSDWRQTRGNGPTAGGSVLSPRSPPAWAPFT